MDQSKKTTQKKRKGREKGRRMPHFLDCGIQNGPEAPLKHPYRTRRIRKKGVEGNKWIVDGINMLWDCTHSLLTKALWSRVKRKKV